MTIECLILGVFLVEGQKNMSCPNVAQTLKHRTKQKQEAAGRPIYFCGDTVHGGMDPLGSPGHDKKLDSRSMNHAARLMKQETWNLNHETTATHRLSRSEIKNHSINQETENQQ